MSPPRFVYDETTQGNSPWIRGVLLTVRNAPMYAKSAHPTLGDAYRFWRTEEEVAFKSFSNTEDLLEHLLENITTAPPQYNKLISETQKFALQYLEKNEHSLEEDDTDTIQFILGFPEENQKETYFYLINQLPEMILEKLLHSMAHIDKSIIQYTPHKNSYFDDIVIKFALEIWEKLSPMDGFSVGETVYLRKSAIDSARPMPLEAEDLRSYLRTLLPVRPEARLG